MRRLTAFVVGLGLATASLAFSGAPASAGRPTVVEVVAAENFWGNIASQLGGAHVSVTSLITNPNADPHLYESSASDAAAIAAARVVIENGVSYDRFMSSLLSADGTNPIVVNAASVLHVTGSDPNPHLWYDIVRVPRVAAAIDAALIHAAPADAADFRNNLRRFDTSLTPILNEVASIRQAFKGAPVAYTERVPGYLLADAGLSVKTPVGFATAIEQGTDPGLGDTLSMQRLITGHRIRVLLYNVQTVTPVTTQIRQLAQQNHIPIVGVSETMPLGLTFQRWQGSQVHALFKALASTRSSTSG
jgi:zinc/manganese transport system substrate-binding protein